MFVWARYRPAGRWLRMMKHVFPVDMNVHPTPWFKGKMDSGSGPE